MAQHPLNSAAWRNFTLDDIEQMSDERIFAFFRDLRWGKDSAQRQSCPSCGTIRKHHFKRTREQWVCKDCGHTFSVTSGTIMKDHKLPLRKLLQFMVVYVHAVKGISASQISRTLGVTMKSAFTLMHKFREALMARRDPTKLSGFVQIDGGHFSGKRRKPRKKKKTTGKQLRDKIAPSAMPTHPNRRIVMTLRECFRPGSGSQKAYRTVVQIARSENPTDATAMALEHIEKDSIVWTDEHPAYSSLAAYFDHATVNHANEFSSDTGVNNNQAESFFCRARRFQIGQIHRLTPKYMMDYAQEMAWREDVRLMGGAMAALNDLGSKLMGTNVSQWWRRYWQGDKREFEILYSASPAAG